MNIWYGSAAIGPRKHGQGSYKKKQDTDFLLIPRIDKTANRRAVEYALAGITYMNSVMNGIIANTLPAGAKTLNKMEEIFLALIQTSKDFKKEKTLVEIHGAELPDPGTGNIKDWRRLCGPHKIVSTMRDGWQEDYRYFLEAAVQGALAIRKERKISND